MYRGETDPDSGEGEKEKGGREEIMQVGCVG